MSTLIEGLVSGTSGTTVPLKVTADGSLVVSGGGGGGGASGDVTAGGTSGTLAQAIQGINNGVPVRTTSTSKLYYNSTSNNTTTNLAAGVSFVGGWEDIFNQPALQVLIDCDQPVRVTIEQAIDAAGVNIVSKSEFVRAKSKDICECIQLNANYARVTVKNIGVSTTTVLSLNTTYGDLQPFPQALTNYGNFRVAASEVKNFNNKLRDAMESWPNNNWPSYSKATGDLIQLEGNACGASYLTLSLDPLTAGTEAYIESDAIFKMPFDLGVGLHTSQRTYGQELSLAIINQEESGVSPSGPTEIQISSIQQATSTLTVNTTANHGLKAGMRIGIYGVNNDSRLNYSALVVATTPTLTQFTCTAGPQGTIGSLTVGPFSPASAFVYVRDAISWATNGTSIIFENGSSTNASFYVKSEGGDATPIGGTINGSHSVTVSSTASSIPVATALNYTARPSTQYFVSQQADRVQWMDAGIDAISQQSSRAAFAQVVPNPELLYKLRFKAKNLKGLTVPNAKIVSVTKTGTTTATVITASNHGLAVGDYIVTNGVRDQTNFANLTTATVVASVVNTTTFTVVWGSAVTATSYGGLVSRVQGQQVLQGQSPQVAQSYSISSSVLVLVGNATWTGVSIGDLVNLYGVRVDTTGADAGIDGVYRVRDLQTTTLYLEPTGDTTIPASAASTNVGGSVIRRTDFRISFVRLFDYERLRVEPLARPASDLVSAFPVAVQNFSLSVNQATAGTISTTTGLGGWYVHPAITGIADIASAALTATNTGSTISNNLGNGFQVTIPVTAVSGTTPTLDVRIEESFDGGTNWVTLYEFQRITAMGSYNSPILRATGRHIRYIRTVSGTSPSFTHSVTRNVLPFIPAEPQKRLMDRTVVPNTLNSVTPVLFQGAANNVQLIINMGAITTTAPAFQLEGSEDSLNWYAIGSPLTAVASSTVEATVNKSATFVRARVSTAGSGATLGYVAIKAWS